MNQNEVDLIYDYLHEYYRYEDGEFISIKQNKLVGHICDDNKISLTLSKKILGKTVLISLAKCVFIYHFKKYPKYIKHINKNSMDNKIENLIEANNRKTTIYNEKTKGVSKTRNRYRAIFSIGNGKAKSVGSWDSKKDAEYFYKGVVTMINSGKTIEESIKSMLLQFPTNNIKKMKYPKGIYLVKNKFVCAIYINKKKLHLGTYNTIKEAQEAYLKTKMELINK